MKNSLNRLLDDKIKPLMERAKSDTKAYAIMKLLTCEKLLKDWELEQSRIGNILKSDTETFALYWTSRKAIGKAIDDIRG